MPKNPFDLPFPPTLEDEVLLVESSGEMPEVALEESRSLCGPWSREEEEAMASAAARAYLDIIRRDLDPDNLGLSHFRGLERAAINLNRLESFLSRRGWTVPDQVRRDLRDRLKRYLEEEDQALSGGRGYASTEAEQVLFLCNRLGLEPGPWQNLLARMKDLPAPDFMGLRALARLHGPKAAGKRLTRRGPRMALELLDAQGSPLKAAVLPLAGPGGEDDPEARRRIELVWAALKLPEYRPE